MRKPITTETRLEVVENGVRWAGNILADVVQNRAKVLSDEQRDALKRAQAALTDFVLAKRP